MGESTGMVVLSVVSLHQLKIIFSFPYIEPILASIISINPPKDLRTIIALRKKKIGYL